MLESLSQENNSHPSSDQRYLERLEFDPALKKSWLNFFVSKSRVVALLIIVLTVAGVYSYTQLPRESDPEVKIPIAVVTTVLPGASPADVEELVTKKMETAIAGIKGIDKVTSNSLNSVSSITVEFDAKQDLDDSIRRLRDKVNSARTALTADAQEPVVTEISLEDQPIWTIVVTGQSDGFALRQYAETIQDELEKIPGIREVAVSGGDEMEFEVAYDPEKLLFYGISADQANQQIAATNLAIPSGNFEDARFVYPVRTDARVFAADEIGNIVVGQTAGGGVVRLNNIAAVNEKAIKKAVYARLSVQGVPARPSVTLSVIKRTGGSIIETVDRAKETVDALIPLFPPGIHYDVSLDMAKFVRQDFEQLTHDFLLTLLLVFGILFAIVGLKEAFVAGLAIPLVFFASFSALLALGMTLNFLSLFSLILALGLLVDDAIVVVSATKQYLRTGKFTPEEAVLLVLHDFKVVLTTTTLTTVWAFLPLLFSTGIMGEYLKSIPVTVSITLIASLFIALMINHPLAAVLERIRFTRRLLFVVEAAMLAAVAVAILSGSIVGYLIAGAFVAGIIWLLWWYERGGRDALIKNEQLVELEWENDGLVKQKLKEQGSHKDASFFERLIHGMFHLNRFLPLYERTLRMILATKKRRMTTIAATLIVFIGAVMLPLTGIVESEFFPASDMDYVYIDIRTPVGVKLDETDRVARLVEERLYRYPEIINFTTLVGRGSPFSYSGASGSNIASITMSLKAKDERSLRSYEFADVLRKDLSDMHEAVISVATPSSGPPSGAAFEARIKGDDLATLDSIAHDLEPLLAAVPGVVNVDTSLKGSAPEYTFTLDQRALAQHSLTAASVGSFLRMAIAGVEVSTVILGNKEVKIMARLDAARIPALDDIQNLQMLNLRNEPVFLKDVAAVSLEPSVDAITRMDQKRTVLLSAGVTAATNSNKVLSQFMEKAEDYKLPEGYSIVYGGENEQNTESVQSVIRAMAIAIILIIVTLIIQFNSFKKAFIVLFTIPLALTGVFIGMAIFGVHLSFPGLIGVLALFGIVVKNAIILMDKINLNIKTGIPYFESIVDAGKARLEAIFITSVCTIFGILPVTLSNELWAALGSAVIFGLLLSSFFTLFIIPTLYAMLVGERERV